MRKPKPSTAPETRPNAHLEERLDAVKKGTGKLLRPRKAKAKAEALPAVAEPQQEPAAPLGTVAVPPGTHPDAYGLVVNEDGLGLHAAPGAHVIVEPIMPAKAGLAVFYMKDARGPIIFDLTRNFRPEFAGPFAPGSEVMPLIELCVPGTGQIGHMRADRVATIHKVRGVFTPAEIMSQHRPAPAALPEIDECPEGMGEHYVEGAAAYPLVRPGETVVYDPSQQEPTHGALCVLQWSGGTRDVMQTNRRSINRGGEESWFVDPVNRPSNRAMLERRLASSKPGLLHASDGPYTEAHLREKIVGTVVGVLVPQHTATPAVVAGAQTDPAAPTDPLAHVHPVSLEEEQGNTAAAADALAADVSPALRTAIEAHRNAFTASRLDPNDSDANMDRHYAVIDGAADAIDAVPSSTLADLRAKLAYLLPRVLPDVNGRDHVARLLAIRDDLDRLCRMDGRGGVRPDLSRVPTSELAAMPFDPIDRSTTPCPVPSREAWIKDADLALPWLRMGWLYLSLDRAALADAMLGEEAQHADDFDHSLQVAARNFDQLARFARAVLDRRMIGIAALAVREGAVDEDEGA